MAAWPPGSMTGSASRGSQRKEPPPRAEETGHEATSQAATRREVLAVINAVLGIATMLFPEWIEELTGVEPDAGSGALEWIITGAVLVAALISALLARRDARRLAADRI